MGCLGAQTPRGLPWSPLDARKDAQLPGWMVTVGFGWWPATGVWNWAPMAHGDSLLKRLGLKIGPPGSSASWGCRSHVGVGVPGAQGQSPVINYVGPEDSAVSSWGPSAVLSDAPRALALSPCPVLFQSAEGRGEGGQQEPHPDKVREPLGPSLCARCPGPAFCQLGAWEGKCLPGGGSLGRRGLGDTDLGKPCREQGGKNLVHTTRRELESLCGRLETRAPAQRSIPAAAGPLGG